MDFQFFWKKWYWFWHDKYPDTDYMVWHNYAGFGPLQIKWYSTLDPAELA